MLGKTARRAQSLINRLGRDLVHKSIAENNSFYDPAAVTTTNTDITGVVFDFRSDEIDGSIIQKHDKLISVSASNADIKKGDIIVDNDIGYVIINIEEVQLGPEKIMYILQGRV